MILLNIFSGIIIDTFGELRDEMNLRIYDKSFNCHICGNNKWTIEKKGQSFKMHRNTHHFIWNYVYLLVGL